MTELEQLAELGDRLDELTDVLRGLERADLLDLDLARAYFRLSQSAHLYAEMADRILFEPRHRIATIRNVAPGEGEPPTSAPPVPPLRSAERSP